MMGSELGAGNGSGLRSAQVNVELQARLRRRLENESAAWIPPTLDQVQALLRRRGLEGLVGAYQSYLGLHWVPRHHKGQPPRGDQKEVTLQNKAAKFGWMLRCLGAHGYDPATVLAWSGSQLRAAVDVLNAAAVAEVERGGYHRKDDFRRLSQNTLSGGVVELNCFFRDFLLRPEVHAVPLGKVAHRTTANYTTWEELQRLRRAIVPTWPEWKRRTVDFLLVWLWETAPRMSSITGKAIRPGDAWTYRDYPQLGDVRPENGVFLFRHVKNGHAARFQGNRAFVGPADEGLFEPYEEYRDFLLAQGHALNGPLFPWPEPRGRGRLTREVVVYLLRYLSLRAKPQVLYVDRVEPERRWPVTVHDIRRGRGRELCLTLGPEYAAEILMDSPESIMRHYRGALFHETQARLTEVRRSRRPLGGS